MKQAMTLQQLALTIEQHRAAKRDWIVPGRTATMQLDDSADVQEDGAEVVTPRLVLPDGNGGIRLRVQSTAHAQIAQRLGIPKRYYDRMLVEQPDLLLSNVNTWLGDSDKRFLVRSLSGDARAFLSDAYRPLDNEDLLEAVLPTLLTELNEGVAEDKQLRVESCNVTPSRLHLKVVTPRLQAEVKEGDVVQAGAVLSNSEIGLGSLSIQPLVYRLICTNGMIANDWGMRRSHVGRRNRFGDLELAEEFYTDETRKADDKALWLKVRDTVRGFFDPQGFERIVNRLREATEEKINHQQPEKVVEVTAKRLGLNDGERTSVLRHLLTDGDMSRYGLHNAITRASQDVDSYQRATELERLGGKVLELPKRDWSQIAQLN